MNYENRNDNANASHC